MKDPRIRKLELLERALTRFAEALSKPKDDIVRDACIQRFEFTFETAWKAIRSHAATEEGIVSVSPRDCFRSAFSLGLIDEDRRWMKMVENLRKEIVTTDQGELPLE